MLKKISIIIPVYNSGKYLKQCLLSICKQRLENIEIIIIDDKSTDNSLKIANYFLKKFKFIKIIINKINVGPSISRNKAINIAKGEYLLFVDSDDYLTDGSIPHIVKKLKNRNIDYLFIRSIDKRTYKVDSNQIKKNVKKIKNNRRLYDLIESNYHFRATCWNFIVRNEFLKEKNINFDNIRIYEDQIFTSKIMMETNNFQVLEKPVYIRRTDEPNSLGRSIGFDLGMSCLKCLVEIEKIISTNKDMTVKGRNYLQSRVSFFLQDFNINLISSTCSEIHKYSKYIKSNIKKLIKFKKIKKKEKYFIFQSKLFLKKDKKNIEEELNNFKKKEVRKILNKITININKNNYLYCANQIAKVILKVCRLNKIKIKGIIDNNQSFIAKKIEGVQVYSKKYLDNKISKNNKKINIIVCNSEKIISRKIIKNFKKKIALDILR